MRNIGIKYLFLFVLVLLALIYAVQYGLDLCYRQRANQKFTTLFSHKADAPIMIFGSSVAYHHFDPSIIKKATGLSAYNMGWDGLFFVQYNALIKEYLSYERESKYIILACDFDNLGKNELITRPDLFLPYLGNEYVYASLSEIEPWKMRYAKYLPGYKLTLLGSSFYKDILFTPPVSAARAGYEPMNLAWDTTEKAAAHMARYNDDIYAELKEAITGINKKGIKVILVMTPVYTEGYKLIENADEIKAKYQSLASNDVYFLDYTTDSICQQKAYFYNNSHMNVAGATQFSKLFAKDMEAVMRR